MVPYIPWDCKYLTASLHEALTPSRKTLKGVKTLKH